MNERSNLSRHFAIRPVGRVTQEPRKAFQRGGGGRGSGDGEPIEERPVIDHDRGQRAERAPVSLGPQGCAFLQPIK